jgi:RimJ/RimL family protein N-acetyltransferase
MREDLAHAITHWRYEPPYTMYDLQPGDEDMLMDPSLQYHAVLDDDTVLAGFACFGEDAQVHGGVYGPDALDIGFSMAPERTGRGDGVAFVATVCRYARKELGADSLRLSVATFNRRAITVYRRLGFRTAQWFIGTTRHGALSFVAMTRASQEQQLPFAV